MLGDTYTIVDMSVWGWSSAAPFLLGAETWSKLANVKRLVDEINQRLAGQGIRTISLADPDHVERYGLRGHTAELEFDMEESAVAAG